MSMQPRSRELRADYEADGVAAHYAAGRWTRSGHARRTHRKEQRIVRSMLAEAAAAAPLGAVLDVPCGAGRFQPLLAGTGAWVVGADVARPMVAEAGARSGAPLLQASADALPLPDGSFDLVFCFRLLHHFPRTEERRAVMAELGRVARRWALVSYFDAASFQAWRHRVRRRRTVRFAQSHADFEAEAAAGGFRVRRRAWVARGISEQVLALLERAG